jgi:hypothetical protein
VRVWALDEDTEVDAEVERLEPDCGAFAVRPPAIA